MDPAVALPAESGANPPFIPARPRLEARLIAALQVFLVCGVPSQLVVLLAFYVADQPLPLDANVSLQFFATFSLFDTALIAILIRLFLALSGESSRDVFVGRRPVRGEVARGLALVPLVLVGVTALVYGLRTLFPSLHTVDTNPYAAYMDSPLDATIFIVVVVLAGGVREELQRAFILHRFDRYLGGPWVGLAIFSVLFGALHFNQGLDAALAVGVLGVLWGVLYITRGSAIASITCHAGFDTAQVLQQLLVKSFGG